MTISPQATEEVFGQEGGGFLACLTISHDDLEEPIRVIDNTVNVTRTIGAEDFVFIAFPFEITLPDDQADSVPKAQLTIDNVSREVAQLIRSITTPPTVTIEVVRISDVNEVEVTLPDFQLRNVEWDALTVTGDLIIDDIAQEQFPQRKFTPSEYPGLF
mgnify:CR=1 FL=1